MPLRPECPVCRSILKENGQVLDIGLKLESVIVAANRSIQGLIATSCVNIIGGLIVVIYHIVSSLGLNELATGNLKIMQVSGASVSAAMYFTRFYRLMNSGQRLCYKIARSRRAFENNIILKECIEAKDACKQNVLQKRLEVYQFVCPISPYALFGLNNKTFYATLATIISYLVILIKLRGMDTPITPINLTNINNTVVT